MATWCRALAAVAALLTSVMATPALAAPAPSSEVLEAAGEDFAGRVDIGGGRELYLECRGEQRPGRPTVVLESGYGNAADIWSFIDPDTASAAVPVLAGVAQTDRVCAYDRPNTGLLDGTSSRSDPVPQPRTAADVVADLHALLHSAGVPGPYVLVGHSIGGLFVRLYASTHPTEVAGLVLVDATNERLRELLTPEQYAWFTASLESDDPTFEQIGVDASFDEMLRAEAAVPLRADLPVVVLSHGLNDPLPPELMIPDLEGFFRAARAAQDDLAARLPGARHVIAEQSGHYIQVTQPDLVVDAVRWVLCEAEPTATRGLVLQRRSSQAAGDRLPAADHAVRPLRSAVHAFLPPPPR
jgi:pimeloyl-ACP methyl ester carboxylesterase